MNSSNLHIVFMGTPDFSVPSLKVLLDSGYDVVGVVTAPDKPAGRGQNIQESPVKQFAKENNLHILQPEKLKDPEFLTELKALSPDLQVVVAFRMLPEAVWALPPMGTFNLHASLLPQYRGAAPINHAIIRGENKTGLTTFFLQRDIDTGHIIFQEEEPISETDTAGDLHDRLMAKGASLVLRTIQAIEQGTNPSVAQDNILLAAGLLKPAPKIFRQQCHIDWHKPGKEIYNRIRGLCPYPAAYCELVSPSGQSLTLKIYRAVFKPGAHTDHPGSIKTDQKTFLHITCADGSIELDTVQLEGKKRLSVEEFLRGFQVTQNYRVE